MILEQQAEHLLRLPDTAAMVGLSRATIYRAVARGEFPKPVKSSRRASAWSKAEILRWIEDRKAERDAA